MEKWQPTQLLTKETMIRYTKKEMKLLDGLMRKTFDGNHVTCHHGCGCREEAIRRMARTILIVQEELGYYHGEDIIMGQSAIKDVLDRITKSLEEE
jgi:hypothetical protein